IERTEERLRIVSDELWQRVKARQSHRSRTAGSKVRAALQRQRRPGGGRAPKYLLSGLLKCSACEANFTLSNGARYQCSSHHDGGSGACDVSLSVLREHAEGVIMEFVQDDLLNPHRLAEIAERYRAAASSEIVIDHGPGIAMLERERANLVAAIKSGALVEELGADLKGVTAELARLKEERPRPIPAPRVMSPETIERRRTELLQRLAEGGPVAREVLREMFPNAIQLQPDDSGKHFWALFADDADMTRINLLYGSREERLQVQQAAVLAAFAAQSQVVGNNGSGGRI
ncbi:MAG: zinc ribbon domain-containing protein, partial [Steroidobacteraceae bacterium]